MFIGCWYISHWLNSTLDLYRLCVGVLHHLRSQLLLRAPTRHFY